MVIIPEQTRDLSRQIEGIPFTAGQSVYLLGPHHHVNISNQDLLGAIRLIGAETVFFARRGVSNDI